MEEEDLNLIQSQEVTKTFIATNADGSAQSLFGYTIKMLVYKDPEDPIELDGEIGVTLTNEVSFTFDSTVNGDIGFYEYEVIATPLVGEPLMLGRGNIAFTSHLNFTTQVHTLINKEALGLILDEDLKTQYILYWKLYLQPAFELEDDEIHDDANWPPLVRFLIAKLVVHDYISQLMQSALATSFGTTVGEITTIGSGNMKSLQTGPSKAEWYDSNESLTKLMAKGANGLSAFDQLSQGICWLAARLGVYLPMCPIFNVSVLPQVGRISRRYGYMVSFQTCFRCGPDRG